MHTQGPRHSPVCLHSRDPDTITAAWPLGYITLKTPIANTHKHTHTHTKAFIPHTALILAVGVWEEGEDEVIKIQFFFQQATEEERYCLNKV